MTAGTTTTTKISSSSLITKNNNHNSGANFLFSSSNPTNSSSSLSNDVTNINNNIFTPGAKENIKSKHLITFFNTSRVLYVILYLQCQENIG